MSKFKLKLEFENQPVGTINAKNFDSLEESFKVLKKKFEGK